MNNKFNIFFFIRFFLFNFILKNFKKFEFEIQDLDINFKNIIFEDINVLKNTFILNKNSNKTKVLQNELFHSFDWLIASKNIGGAQSINIARKYIVDWSKKSYSLYSNIWNIEITSKRTINLLYFYDLYSQGITLKEKKIINNIIQLHYEVIIFNLEYNKLNKLSIVVLKSCLLVNFILKKNINKIVKNILDQINTLVDKNGFHKSYNPVYQAEYINNLQEIKNIYLFFNKSRFKELDFIIYNMTSSLSNFFHKDGSLALFNGSNNLYKIQINKIINQIENLKLINVENKRTGIAIYSDKYKKVFFDKNKPSDISNKIHSGTQSFEFSCDQEKIITNCGSINYNPGSNPDYLRFSAAHSTIIINNTNISELNEKNGLRRMPRNITFSEFENDESTIFESSHDGYINNYGKIVKRKIKIFKKQNKIEGVDTIVSIKKNNKKNIYDIRFHLMPGFKCLLTNNKKSVLIKSPKNNSWIFTSNSQLSVEDSIYVGDGKSSKQNKQIVITNFSKDIKKIEQWTLQKI